MQDASRGPKYYDATADFNLRRLKTANLVDSKLEFTNLTRPIMSFEAKFTGTSWSINPPSSRKDRLTVLAGVHELGHAFITNTSSIGGIILLYQTLSLWAKEGQERYHRLWVEMVHLSREAHEAFATSFSVIQFDEHDSDLYARLPDEYRKFNTLGQTLLTGLTNPFLRITALFAIFRVCFESPTLTTAACHFENFETGQVRAREYPDERLRKISRLLPPGFFEAEYSVFVSSLAAGPILDAILRTDSVTKFSEVFDTESRKIADAAEEALSIWLHGALARLLQEDEMQVNPWATHLDVFATQFPIVESLCRNDYEPVLSVAVRNMSSAESVLRLLENEIVILRKEPLPAKLVYVSELDPDVWEKLDHTLADAWGISHFFVDVQFSQELLSQYRFSAEANAELTLLSGPVAFIHTVDATDEGTVCTVFVFSNPLELELFSLKCQLPVFGSLPISVLLHQTWDDAWRSAWSNLKAVSIVDSWLLNLLEEIWSEIAFIRYAREDFDCPSGRLSLVVLELDPDEGCAPQMVVGSGALTAALMSYIESLEDHRFEKDSLVIERNFESISKAMNHIVHARRFLSRNKNQFIESVS